MYLQKVREEEVDPEMYPLDFWKVNKLSFPILSRLALAALTVPATSVSAERVFSAAGLLGKQHLRNRLNPATMERLLLVRLNSLEGRARELSYIKPADLVPTLRQQANNANITFGHRDSDSSSDEEEGEEEEEE